ncbi:MAG: CDP-diacylglycerol--glycerol-3-phosphate 3-phosphatidyltransferase [Acidiferrobacteraceae bacterium]|jgi:CDP-diacylglycerol--glycerol-3-phosphate 3-phosphatidyltransferase|nr:CDP-diacylglycerol--glycerol-3-phosphate 3-phosphatidyltransferase [Acidiferrobacteraceae bacterium]MAG01592.1 CDP-diacylglycerol--glycerol-3-phosphate 3-phosphatidyltransferase [Acidiferrobacteraceae bacterium]MDP6434401.1 CDP-diacylglycerol--glycerol-3-phosphate 3-phosphatidyltransferase [Arenicellales bacterium]MDP6671700.1 CDP-diacylglycerol--glycerol-3-phosphate 3-phosphatidyltransferase [Arenicellales bacterium]MDP6723623.1 CDP-diacylglycerol--glycerol-3-phosphate 3-phosphatidyltransfe|tara:strand:- start:9 stop:617 length:609 start_codon:yes stop_codon:yes gene_type:complete
MNLNIPNILTFARIIMIPVLILFYFLPLKGANEILAAIFVFAGITDWLDGYLARKLKQGTAFGAFLDPVADKLIVCAALVLLLGDDRVMETVYSRIAFILACVTIIGREIVISALREWMAELGKRASVAVNILGKVKTVVQIVAITMLLYFDTLFELPMVKLGELLLYLSAAFTLWSMVVYLRSAWPILTAREGLDRATDSE